VSDFSESVSVPEGPQYDCVLVRYGELALKSRRVRAKFTAQLREFILETFQVADMDCVVEHDGGHLYVYSSDLEAAADRLRRAFGVVSVSPSVRVEATDVGGLVEHVVAYSRNVLEPSASFAIRARRAGTHPFTSMDVAKAAGAAVLDAFDKGVTVDLTGPDVELEVEVRGPVAYLYHRRMAAVGGLPPGSQGKVLCPVRTTDDVLAAWLLMRRGCAAVVTVPEGDGEARALAQRLVGWDPRTEIRALPMDEWEWPALYREMGRSHSLAVVSGARGPDVPELPPDRGESPVAFFPLVGLDDEAHAVLEAKVLEGRMD
jgi:thiamine biosynthesis protein ThiI